MYFVRSFPSSISIMRKTENGHFQFLVKGDCIVKWGDLLMHDQPEGYKEISTLRDLALHLLYEEILVAERFFWNGIVMFNDTKFVSDLVRISV